MLCVWVVLTSIVCSGGGIHRVVYRDGWALHVFCVWVGSPNDVCSRGGRVRQVSYVGVDGSSKCCVYGSHVLCVSVLACKSY